MEQEIRGTRRERHNCESVYFPYDSVQKTQRAVGAALARDYATYTGTPNGLLETAKDARNNLTVSQYDGQDRLFRQ